MGAAERKRRIIIIVKIFTESTTEVSMRGYTTKISHQMVNKTLQNKCFLRQMISHCVDYNLINGVGLIIEKITKIWLSLQTDTTMYVDITSYGTLDNAQVSTQLKS